MLPMIFWQWVANKTKIISIGNMFREVLSTIFLTFLGYQCVYCAGKFYIWGVSTCTGPNYTISGQAQFKNISGGQMIRVNIYMKEPAGDDNKWDCKVSVMRGSQKRQLFNFKGTGMCSSLNQYLGGLWHVAERISGVDKPGVCPVPKKSYTLEWIAIPYEIVQIRGKALIDLAPVGVYHAQCVLYDSAGKLIKGCAGGYATKSN